MHARLRRLVVSAALLLGLLATSGLVVPAAAVAAVPVAANAYESDLLARMNAARGSAGLAGLTVRPGLTDLARSWATTMSQQGSLSHNPNLGDQLTTSGSSAWRSAAENVGVGGTSSAVFTAYMNSTGHRENILRTSVSNVGVGTARSADGRVWDVVVFTDAYDDAYGAGRTAVPPINADGSAGSTGGGGAAATGAGVYLASSPGGAAAPLVTYGQRGDVYLSCDWDGNGTDTLGVFRSGTWYLRNSNSAGTADGVLSFGDPGDQPICGDWDGDGVDTVGVFRQGQVYLRNANSTGPANGAFVFGAPGDTAVVGNWDGDRYATLGVVRGGTWYLSESNTSSAVSRRFGFGNGTDQPLAGHFYGGRADGVGVGRWS